MESWPGVVAAWRGVDIGESARVRSIGRRAKKRREEPSLESAYRGNLLEKKALPSGQMKVIDAGEERRGEGQTRERLGLAGRGRGRLGDSLSLCENVFGRMPRYSVLRTLP